MKALRTLLLLVLLALLVYAGLSFFSPDRQKAEVEQEHSGSEQPDSVVLGIPERLIDAALQADSSGLEAADGPEQESPQEESE